MQLVVPDLGELFLLNTLLFREDVLGEVWNLHLFKNDYSPNRESVLADFEEATFASYSAVPMARADWTYPTTVGGIATSYYRTVSTVFTPGSGSEVIYGIYVTDEADTVALWAGRFDTPITATPINPVAYRPFMRLRSQFQPAP